MKKQAPPILFYEAPMSYMTENPANKFYHGLPPPEDQIKKVNNTALHGHSHDESMFSKVINYCIVQPRYEKKISQNIFDFGATTEGLMGDAETRSIVGARLVGIIPCSDARGYDILIKDFREAETKNKKIKEQEMKVMKNDDNFQKFEDKNTLS